MKNLQRSYDPFPGTVVYFENKGEFIPVFITRGYEDSWHWKMVLSDGTLSTQETPSRNNFYKMNKRYSVRVSVNFEE